MQLQSQGWCTDEGGAQTGHISQVPLHHFIVGVAFLCFIKEIRKLGAREREERVLELNPAIQSGVLETGTQGCNNLYT